MTLDEQIKAVDREIGMRVNVYPGWVNKGRMSQTKADHEIAAMREVKKTLESLRDGHRAEPQTSARILAKNSEQHYGIASLDPVRLEPGECVVVMPLSEAQAPA